MNAAQSQLFKLQLWHLRRQQEFERSAKKAARLLGMKRLSLTIDQRAMLVDRRTAAIRKARQHRHFVDIITPFVSIP